MENRSYALLTGVFLLGLGVAILVAAIWLGHTGEERKPYLVVTDGSVSGLNVQSTVRYRGVNVGKVTGIHFAPDNFSKIQIRIEVDADIPLTDTTYAQLQAQGITGLSRLELRDDNGKRGKILTTSTAHPARIPMHPSLIQEAGDIAENLLGDADKLLDNFNKFLGGDTSSRAQKIISNLEQATDGVVRIERQLDPTLEQLPKLTRNLNSLVNNMDSIASQLQGIGKTLKQTAQNAQDASSAGAAAGQQLSNRALPRVNQLLERLDTSAQQLNRLARQLQQQPQSLLYGPARQQPGPGERPPEGQSP